MASDFPESLVDAVSEAFARQPEPRPGAAIVVGDHSARLAAVIVLRGTADWLNSYQGQYGTSQKLRAWADELEAKTDVV